MKWSGIAKFSLMIFGLQMSIVAYGIPITQPTTASIVQKGPAVCQKLTNRMQAVDNKTLLTTVHAINDDLKSCVISANNEQRLSWMVEHGEMYEQLLKLSEQDQNDAFYRMAENYDDGKVKPSNYANLTPRVRYLASQLGDSELTVLNEGEGNYSFWYQLATTTDIFAPYLPEDQAIYVKRMAKENQEMFYMDAAIVRSYDDIIQAGLFWENFARKYPTSKFTKLAKVRFNFYQDALFFGSDNTQWTDDTISKLDDTNFASLKKLSKVPDSEFAKHAQQYLQFLAMSKGERNDTYKISMLDDNDSPKTDWQLSREQLEKALNIPKPTYDEKASCTALMLPCR